MAKHAKMSPSKSDRWMNCPGSLILEEKCPAQETSEYAAEGTAAHQVAAECLSLNRDAGEWVGQVINVLDKYTFKVTEDMAEAIQVYLDPIRQDMREDGVPELTINVEQKLELKSIDKTLYGTCDAYYTSPFGRLKVYDLKFGRGVFVEAEDNPQLLIYALGAWNATDRKAEEVEVIIVQPRYPGEEKVRRAVYTRAQLLEFEKELKKAVKAVNKGSEKLQTGTWCKFCPAQGVCSAKTDEVFSVVPAEQPLPKPATMTIEQIVKLLSVSDVISDWAAAVHKHAESLAQSGVPIPGYKLVQKRGNRRWIDEMAVETAFETLYGEDIYAKKLKSPAKLEKVVGKDAVKEYVEIPDNGTQLVPESAKGEPVTVSAGQVFNKLT